MVTEGGAPVVVALEAMRHVNLEAFFLKLRVQKRPLSNNYYNHKVHAVAKIPKEKHIQTQISNYLHIKFNCEVKSVLKILKSEIVVVAQALKDVAHHGIATVGGRASALADDFFKAFFVDCCIAF